MILLPLFMTALILGGLVFTVGVFADNNDFLLRLGTTIFFIGTILMCIFVVILVWVQFAMSGLSGEGV